MVNDGRAVAQTAHVADIMQLVDRMEEIVTSGMRVPLSNRIMVEEEEFLSIIDQLRLSVPQEIKQARRVVQERQQILGTAQDEAAKILSVAKERAEYLMNEQGLINEAKSRSEEILRQAKDGSKRSMGEVDVYALQILTQLEQALQQNLQQIQQAKNVIGR
ncbi:MAG TPA: ATPase [Nitrolancea sp.]|nr:ATPase [Nitrolancea sp.]